ncbi:maleylpyruvate isomerase family mycothiol-dependent enzyme [Kytococcus sedentarius]|uniref:maleylpyruvate isomerase family mycothiol-dependent enzyme n=1 Tax=Kytococcus sedentarius TaxID=1276 RepID=UPI0035BBA0EF
MRAPSPDPGATWAMVHEARAALATDLAGLSAQQWGHRTLCSAWDVRHVTAHLTAAASTGRWAWLRSIAAARFRPDVHNERRLREHLGGSPAETLERFRQVVDATVAPTGDLGAWLGEVVVHSEDIRHPLGLPDRCDPAAAAAVAAFLASRDFAVPSRSRVKGLSLAGTDSDFHRGEGLRIEGPTLALVMVMAGRRSHLDRLEGPGVAPLASRLTSMR